MWVSECSTVDQTTILSTPLSPLLSHTHSPLLNPHYQLPHTHPHTPLLNPSSDPLPPSTPPPRFDCLGEYQTVKQTGLFPGLLGWERDFGPMTSEAPRQSAQMLVAVLADVGE